MIRVAAAILARLTKKVKLLLNHEWQGFEPRTSMEGEANVLSMDIELTTFGQVVVMLANCTMTNFLGKSKMSVYVRT